MQIETAHLRCIVIYVLIFCQLDFDPDTMCSLESSAGLYVAKMMYVA